jgi:hypothetical protein
MMIAKISVSATRRYVSASSNAGEMHFQLPARAFHIPFHQLDVTLLVEIQIT